MSPAEHKIHHLELHAALEDLFADYIVHHPQDKRFSRMPISELLTWSHQQCAAPTEIPPAMPEPFLFEMGGDENVYG